MSLYILQILHLLHSIFNCFYNVSGHQIRNVNCASTSDFAPVSDYLCDPRLQPETNKTCNEQPCQARSVSMIFLGNDNCNLNNFYYVYGSFVFII